MDLFQVDSQKCRRDGICAAECPARIIEKPTREDFPVPAADASDFCLRCGHCVAVCPHGALSLSWLSPEDCPPVKEELALSPEQAEQFLRSRRSIRTFREKPVERETLEKLLDLGCHAPSAKNNQTWHFLVVENSSEVRRLAGMVVEWMTGFMESSPVRAGELGFVRVVKSWDEGYDRICRGAPHMVIVHGERNWPFGVEDCTLALSYLELYATALGLGTCWAGYLYTAVNQHPPLFKRLALPPEHRVYGAMMLGYPRYKYPRLPLRNPPRVTWR